MFLIVIQGCTRPCLRLRHKHGGSAADAVNEREREREREREIDCLPRRRCLRSSGDTGSLLLHALSERLHLILPQRCLSNSGLGSLLLSHRLSERHRLVVVEWRIDGGPGDGGDLAGAEVVMEMKSWRWSRWWW